MLNNVALDVCIGLIFIFLLYSLLATIVQEIIAQWLSLRPRMLMKAVRNMLEDRTNRMAEAPEDNTIFSYISSGIRRWWAAVSENWKHFKCPLSKNGAAKAFYRHPAIKYLSESSWNSKPAYIAPSSFANTLMLLLRGEDYDGLVPQMNKIKDALFDRGAIDANGITYAFDDETLRYLRQLYRDAQGDADRFRALLEKWYNDTMDRVAGWYKRQTQFILFLIGFAIALIFNADTIAITNILSKDKTVRENLVQLAINSQSRYDTLIQKVNATKVAAAAKRDNGGKEPQAHVTPEVPATSGKQDKDSAAAAGTRVEKKEKAPEAPVPPDTVVVKETVALVDPQLKEALGVTLGDIDKANYILGLGWQYKDTSKGVRVIIDSLDNRGFTKEQQVIIAQALIESKANREDCKPRKFLQFHPLQKGGLFTIFGWILTALAISLGAPFWFDLLNKAIRLRAAGTKPAAGADNINTMTGQSSSGQPVSTSTGAPAEQLKVTDRKG
jgi:hypothetical protein